MRARNAVVKRDRVTRERASGAAAPTHALNTLRGRMLPAALLSALLGALPGAGLASPLAAQPAMPRSMASIPSLSAESATTSPLPSFEFSTGAIASQPARGLSPWYAPLLSALVPGAGQGLLRQQRGVAYLAAEGYLILQALGSHRDASRERDAYREIARTVARAQVAGERPDGAWAYYERMQHVLESGVYNASPSAGFTPESDPETFNGSIWLLARETYWLDPDSPPAETSAEYQRALNFYKARAASDAFLWSWRDAQLQQDLYRQTIHRSNEASRRAKQMTGLLLANHALSLVDAYVSVRIRVFGTPSGDGSQRFGVVGTIPMPSRD